MIWEYETRQLEYISPFFIANASEVLATFGALLKIDSYSKRVKLDYLVISEIALWHQCTQIANLINERVLYALLCL